MCNQKRSEILKFPRKERYWYKCKPSLMLKIDRHSIRSSAEYKTKHRFELHHKISTYQAKLQECWVELMIQSWYVHCTARVLQSRDPDLKFSLAPLLLYIPGSRPFNTLNPGSRKTYWGPSCKLHSHEWVPLRRNLLTSCYVAISVRAVQGISHRNKDFPQNLPKNYH